MSDATAHRNSSRLLSFSHSCGAFEARLDGWFELDAERRDALRRESRRCASCRDALQAQQDLEQLLSAARREIEGAPALGTVDAERDAPPEQTAGPTQPHGAPEVSRVLLSLAAALLLALASAVAWSPWRAQETASPTHGRASAEAAFATVPEAASARSSEAPVSQPDRSRDLAVTAPRVAELEPSPRVSLTRLPPPLPSASAASAALRSVKHPRLQAMRPSPPAGRFSFRVPSAPARPNSASGR